MNDVAVPRFPARPCPHDFRHDHHHHDHLIHDMSSNIRRQKTPSPRSGRAAYRPSDAVDVIVNVLAHVKVDHMRNILDV